MFSMTLRKSHSERRRVLGNVYSKSALYTTLEIQKFSEVLLLERLFPIIEEAAWKQTPLDVLELSLSISIDFATAYLFGIQNSTNFLQDVVTRKRWLHAHDRSKEQSFLAVEFPGMTSIIESLRISSQPPETALSSKEVQDLCLQMIQKVESSSFSSSEVASMHESMKWTKPVVYEQLLRQLQPVFDRKAPVPSPDTASQLRLTIASELMDHIIAGTETNGWTLTYIMYELSLHPEFQSSLRSELFSLPSPMVYTKTSFPSQTPSANADLPSPRTLDSLPILDAIVLETLRRYPSVPGAQPRTSRTHISLDHYADIPPGIRVSAQAYSLHRNADVFPDPESWSPMRWLTCDKEARENMMRWFWAFGSGGRMCIGNHFALLG
jgi:unspecific monooxygenase